AATLEDKFGALHGLLHNAVNLGANTPLQHYDIDLWYKVMQVNLNAPFLLTQALLPLMIKTPDSSIVFTLDDKDTAYWGAYGISKKALKGLMKILADEMDTDKPVKVNAINPGPVKTQLRMKAFPGEDPNVMVPAEDIMQNYLYLMGHESNKETGKVFNAQ
ncbi:MAG: SDR family NAD(P)-dependent oxidoreductase, partial [Gammaproteobacteria bacterium]|nr:SDR family NAD(P)-dependent oxidoreductase [Gammaproteobacteria bacterium]